MTHTGVLTLSPGLKQKGILRHDVVFDHGSLGIDVTLDHFGLAAALGREFFTKKAGDIIAVEIAASYDKGISVIIITIKNTTVTIMG